MGLGITRASLVSAVAEDTGNDSVDSVVKIKRLINRIGKDFCMITNWPFLYTDISFSITNSGGYKYSGAAYLPTTYKRVIKANIVYNNNVYDLKEVGIQQAYEWDYPAENEGIPEEFCITRIESGYWEIQFDKTPDQTYTVYADIEQQWSELSADDSETLVTKPYEASFVHFLDMARFRQQGDLENYSAYKAEWYDAFSPMNSVLGRILASLQKPSANKGVSVDPEYLSSFVNFEIGDYH